MPVSCRLTLRLHVRTTFDKLPTSLCRASPFAKAMGDKTTDWQGSQAASDAYQVDPYRYYRPAAVPIHLQVVAGQLGVT